MRTETKTFTHKEFEQAMRACSFVAVRTFWHALESLAHPEARTCRHARGLLSALAEIAFEDCQGRAFSAEEAEAFTYCGLTPVSICAPGVLGR